MATRATVIAHSVSPTGKKIITWETYYPWQIHGEVMTHRLFSRNASSNRAIPVAKMLEEVRDPARRAYPSFASTGKDKDGNNIPGMQGGPPPTAEQLEAFYYHWDTAALNAARTAEHLVKIGAAKQDANRLLMPFTHAHTLITTTETDNFFGLRLDTMADPTMQALAITMWDAMKASTPKLLQPGQWHLPFVDDNEFDLGDVAHNPGNYLVTAIKISVARCARVSYQEVETQKRSTIEADLAMYDRLLAGKAKHASPAEHQATPDAFGIDEHALDGRNQYWLNKSEHGNFVGWRQYRKMLPGEAVAPLPEKYA